MSQLVLIIMMFLINLSKDLSEKKIIITGASGFSGKNISKALKKNLIC